MRRSPIRRKKRTASAFARIYGSRERVEWVKSLPCVVCSYGPSENAHTENGGMGRKADYTTIVPLCHAHHMDYDEECFPVGVSEWIRSQAAYIEKLWQSYQQRRTEK